MITQELLPQWDDRLPWKYEAGGLRSVEFLRGHESTALTVVAATSDKEPTKGELQALFKAKAKGGADPVLVGVEYPVSGGTAIALFGPTETAAPLTGLERQLAEQVIEHALESESPLGLYTDLTRSFATLRGGVGAGVRNEGLFASHVLEQQPDTEGWVELCETARPLLRRRGQALMTGLGYDVEALPDGVVLRDHHDGSRRAAAVLLQDGEAFDNPLGRFHGSNAVSHGLAVARRESVDWLVVTGGSVVRLYPVDPDVGVGRKGQTQTFVEIDLSLLTSERAGFLSLLFSPGALAAEGGLQRLLHDSMRFATGLAQRLRDRIYEDVVPHLAVAVARRHDVSQKPKPQRAAALAEAYHQAMILLFRLLFVAYAEDRNLLPVETSEAYRGNALKTLGRRILDDLDQRFSATSTSLWDDLVQVWKVIDTGDVEGWGVPPYNGGLFTRDPVKNASGAAAYGLELTNAEIGPVLRGLLIDTTPDGVLGLVDFRSLSVREFGTIYEGLLESGLGVAEMDLALDDEEYVPAERGGAVAVAAGGVYFHSRSGSRKATGSYFTKPFAVEHLLDHALEPALDDHLDRIARMVASGATQSAATALFDFRVVDLSMGSAHFLVAAVDRIEARFSTFLIDHPLPEVAVELDRLRTTACGLLRIEPAESGIDDAVLLRRQIARRCIYGVDLNEIAVELARLAVWIHTFVPGLPLSFLNHGLVWGNSLTGVGTLEEISAALRDAEARETKTAADMDSFLLDAALRDFLDRAAEHLEILGALADGSVQEVSEANRHQSAAQEALAPLAALCDLITAERMTRHLRNDDPQKVRLSAGGGRLFSVADADSLEKAILEHPHLALARAAAATVQAAHLPVRYPEVFRRDRPGFDVILGNPPWEKLKVEEHGWWAVRFPGLRSMSQLEKNRAIAVHRKERKDLVEEYEADVVAAKLASQTLTAGPYPGIGATDVDLFAAFCWRFLHESRHGGRIGVVLPRTALAGAATTEWRRHVLADSSINDLTMLTNTARWAFDMEPRYTIALLSIHVGAPDHVVRLRGPFAKASEYEEAMRQGDEARATVDAETVISWSDSAAIPLIPASDVDVFSAMKRHPSLGADLGSWRLRPLAELHTTKEKRFYDFDLAHPKPSHTLPIWTGGTFNLWAPGSGDPYAYADPDVIEEFLQKKRHHQAKLRSSAFFEMPEGWAEDDSTLPMLHPRVAFRDVCRSTDSRTLLCALVPPGVALVHKAPYLVRIRGDVRAEAFVLGVISSRPFDWFARRFVELAMTFELLNSFPVPRVADEGHLLDLAGQVRLDGANYGRVCDRVVEISGRLAAVDDRYADWAAEVGVPVGSVTSEVEKADLVAELDALVALLYGLNSDQLQKVFATFHRGWDHERHWAAVKPHYDLWAATLSVETVSP